LGKKKEAVHACKEKTQSAAGISTFVGKKKKEKKKYSFGAAGKGGRAREGRSLGGKKARYRGLNRREERRRRQRVEGAHGTVDTNDAGFPK